MSNDRTTIPDLHPAEVFIIRLIAWAMAPLRAFRAVFSRRDSYPARQNATHYVPSTNWEKEACYEELLRIAKQSPKRRELARRAGELIRDLESIHIGNGMRFHWPIVSSSVGGRVQLAWANGNRETQVVFGDHAPTPTAEHLFRHVEWVYANGPKQSQSKTPEGEEKARS